MNFIELIKSVLGGGQQQLISPIPENYNPQFYAPSPTPTPTQPYRNPRWETWKETNPRSFAELLAGTQEASQNTGVPQELLMDISGLETTGGRYLDQMGGGVGRGYYQFEPATTQDITSNMNPYSATDSANLAAKEIAGGRLSRWGTPSGQWGSLNNPKNMNGKLTDFYSKEELNRYLAPKFQFK